jgi:hypothetical protein
MSRLNLVCTQVMTQQQARVRIAEILTRKRTFYKGQWDHLDTLGARARKWRHYVKEIAAEGTWGGSLELDSEDVTRSRVEVTIDTASIDHGPSTDFLAHRVVSAPQSRQRG